jgi:hypothetical protein
MREYSGNMWPSDVQLSQLLNSTTLDFNGDGRIEGALKGSITQGISSNQKEIASLNMEKQNLIKKKSQYESLLNRVNIALERMDMLQDLILRRFNPGTYKNQLLSYIKGQRNQAAAVFETYRNYIGNLDIHISEIDYKIGVLKGDSGLDGNYPEHSESGIIQRAY